jgi:hypothetical protein
MRKMLSLYEMAKLCYSIGYPEFNVLVPYTFRFDVSASLVPHKTRQLEHAGKDT